MKQSLTLICLVILSAAFAIGCGGVSNRANITIGAMPANGTFHGVWQSPQYGEMHLCQTGSNVAGTYTQNERNGRVQGTIQGNVLRFQWEDHRELVPGRPTITRGRGYFKLEVGDDEDQYFLGEWGHDDAEVRGGPWNAVKLRRRNPDECQGSGANVGGRNNDGGDLGGLGDLDDEGDDFGAGGGGTDDFSGGGGGGMDDDSDLQGLDEF